VAVLRALTIADADNLTKNISIYTKREAGVLALMLGMGMMKMEIPSVLGGHVTWMVGLVSSDVSVFVTRNKKSRTVTSGENWVMDSLRALQTPMVISGKASAQLIALTPHGIRLEIESIGEKAGGLHLNAKVLRRAHVQELKRKGMSIKLIAMSMGYKNPRHIKNMLGPYKPYKLRT